MTATTDESFFHVTAIRKESAYGHADTHCDESGCSGDELLLTGVDPGEVAVGHIYEIDENGKVLAEVEA